MTTAYTVTAKRWAHGWELHIRDDQSGHIGVTQSRTLEGADRMVRDYIESLTDHDATDDEVTIRPDLGGLEERAAEARARVEEVQRKNREVAADSRSVAHELRDAGLSVTDTAVILGVSRGRASQLVRT
ncbi:MAG: hypothetical protein ACRDN9_15835 [Streptosporangiaceae bacterium]